MSLTLIGLAIGAVGIGAQYLADPGLFGGFPPGILFLAGAAALVVILQRWSWSPVFAIALCAWVTIGGLAGAKLVRNIVAGNALLTTGSIVMQVGLLLGIVAGVVAIVTNRRQRRHARVA